MEKEKAIMLAKNHINEMNQNNPYEDKIQWIVPEPKEVENGWYFDYEYDSIDPDEEFMMGGAPGFIVLKASDSIEVVSWQTYHGFRFQS